MNLGSCFVEMLLLVPIMANSVAESGTPAHIISNKIPTTTTTTESNAWKPELECFDLYGERKCKVLRDQWKFCKYAGANLMNEMCRKTCGFCKLRDDCTTSKYKCCEDGITTKNDLQGSNCPGCKDKHSKLCQKYAKDCNDLGWAGSWMQANCRRTCQLCKGCTDKHAKLCQKYAKDCNDLGWAGSWMQANCQRTCQLCKEKPTCADDTEQGRFCTSWKKNGLCNVHASFMRTYCTKTCGFCGLGKHGEILQGHQNAVEKQTDLFRTLTPVEEGETAKV